MRSFQQAKTKKDFRRKNNKKKRTKNLTSAWIFRSITHNKNLEKINEALRIHKAHSSTRCSWKLVPKDSCEVYKERRKRQIESKRHRPRSNSKNKKIGKRMSHSKSSERSRTTFSETSCMSASTTTSRDSRASSSEMDYEHIDKCYY